MLKFLKIFVYSFLFSKKLISKIAMNNEKRKF